MTELSIIIVSWNVKEKLRENLTALYQSVGDLGLEVFVVDNHSHDGTVAMIQQSFPRVRLIPNNHNLGFAKANNQALRQAEGKYVLLLNPDMKVLPDTLQNMVNWMDANPQASLAGCHLVDQNLNTILHVRQFPTLNDQLAIVLKLPHLFKHILKNYLQENFDYTKAAKVDSVRGGFFMLRQKTIEKIGLLDEQYFIWFEEVDYCKRVYAQGGEVWYTPTATCIDYVGQSFKQVKNRTTQAYFKSSMLKYFLKWQPKWQYYVLLLAWPFGQTLAWVGGLFHFARKAKT
ncbi:MAG: glycosyltransferase family 2 protein [Candidatus Falkowbacteria bacterium]